MDIKDIPQWARDEAMRLANDQAESNGMDRFFSANNFTRSWPSVQAFAAYVAKHGKEPVDPDLVVAREASAAAKDHDSVKKKILAGDGDHMLSVRCGLAAIKLYKETHKQCSC